jgi:hypothetical protein
MGRSVPEGGRGKRRCAYCGKIRGRRLSRPSLSPGIARRSDKGPATALAGSQKRRNLDLTIP